MKKLVNSIALLVLVSVNVLTPISYAQETPTIVEEDSSIVVFGEEEQELDLIVDDGIVGDLPEVVEDLPEILEDDTPSLIDMVVDTVLEDIDNNFNSEQENGGDGEIEDLDNDVEVLNSYDENPLFIMDGELQLNWEENVDFYTISIWNPSNVNNGFTIMDRNLGAISNDITTTDSYGYYYQWGNNYGFPAYGDVSTSSTQVDALGYGPGNYYNSSTFIISSSNPWGWDSSDNGNLWGGESSDVSGKQGPCPNGYHIPSNSEWGLLFKYWVDIYAPGTALTKYGGGANLYGTANEDDRDATLGFIDYFKLPLAGGRTPSDASIKSNGYGGDYWSSSPEEGGSFAGILRLFVGSYQYIVSAGSFSARANGYSLRCFRDAYIVPNLYYISFDTQGGSEISDKMAVENTPRKMPENPTKNNYIFAGWYTSTGYTDVFDFSTLATEDTIVYAKWEICPEGYEIVNNKCLFKTRGITYQNGIIKISDGENEIWLRDRNVGAMASVGLDKANQIYNLSNELCVFQHIASLESAEEDKNLFAEMIYDVEYCTGEFYQKVSEIIGTQVTTIGGVNEFLNSYNSREDTQYKKSFGNYYFWGNNGYATYDEMNFTGDGYSTLISQLAMDRGFMEGGKMDERNTGWEEGKTNNPCDATKGEYLPTAEDWANLMNIWANLNDANVVSRPTVGNLGSPKGNLRFQNYEDGMKFSSDMLLPTAGSIYFSTADECSGPESLETQSCGINEWRYENNYSSYLWTARDDGGSIGSYGVDEGSVFWSQWINNNGAYPVRCFMVANPVTVNFVTNGGSNVQSYKVPEGSSISEPSTPKKDGYTFVGWYTEDGEKWDFENDIVEEDMTLYAKWRVCGGGFTVQSNKCVPNDMDMKGIIEVSDGVDTMYIRDRNAGVTNHDVVMCVKVESYAYGLGTQPNECNGNEECIMRMLVDYINELWETTFTVEQMDQIQEFFQDHCSDFEGGYGKELFGNYYFWGNNNGVNAEDLELGDEENNSDRYPIQNMSELDPKFLEGGKIGSEEGSGWIQGNTNNPCDGEWEYLPTPEDWIDLINIWANKNGYDLNVGSSPIEQVGSLSTFAMDSAGYFQLPSIYSEQFLLDMLIPRAGIIRYRYNPCVSEEGFNCDKLYVEDLGPALWLSQDVNGYLGVFGQFGVSYDSVNNAGDEANNMAAPVRCFVNVPEVLVVTLNSDGRVYKELNVVKGNTLTEPAAPGKSNHVFDGWYTEDGEKYDFDTPFTEDITLYAKWTENKGNGYSGGGGGSSSKPKTEQVDKQHNVADEETKKAEPEIKKEEGKNIKIITNAPVNTEKETFNAHQWAYSKGLTKYRTSSEARMDDFLNRSEMAKISSIFATEFLDKTPDTKKKEFCSQYSDMWKVEDDMKFFIAESCELGYMGYESNGIDALERFRPYTPLTVAETATILSRIVWGNENAMNGKDWYKGHLYAAYNYGLIDDIKDPTTRSITRREAYTMLYRLVNMVE